MHDLRLAFRALRATPVVSVVAVLSLALGIGANTAIFSLVDRLLLRSLPVADPARLARLSSGGDESMSQYSYTLFERLRERRDLIDGALAWKSGGLSQLTHAGTTDAVQHQFVSGDYFSALGVAPLLGRPITIADDVPGGGPDGPVAVIGYGLWRTRFGGDPAAVGARVMLDRAVVTIVGVMPPAFTGLVVGSAPDVTLPVRAQPLVQPATPLTDDMGWLYVLVRLRPGQRVDQASAALRAAQPQLRAAAMPRDVRDARQYLKDPLALVPAGAGLSPLRRRFERPLVMLLVVAAVVLVAASANVANLLLARGTARRHELSVRLALGASPWRLARLLLIESVVLASIGAAAGALFGVWAARAAVSQLSTPTAPVVLSVSLDWRMLAAAAVAMTATALLFGAWPALRAARVHAVDALKEQGRATGAAGDDRAAAGLVVAQVALSLVLVAAAGLFVRTFERLAAAPLGLDRDRSMAISIAAPTVPAAERNAFYHRLVDAVAAVPGVAAAGGAPNPPIVGSMLGDFVVSEPGVEPLASAEHISQSTEVTRGWFGAYGMTMLAGRAIDERDRVGTPPVMVVNQAFVRRFVGRENPIGKAIALTFRMPQSGDFLLGTKTIVGVVGDSIYRSIRDPLRPTIYLALAQRDEPILVSAFYITYRAAAGSPESLTRPVSAALLSANPDLGLTFHPVAEQVQSLLAQDRLVAMLSGFFGVLALLLAALGLYGVTAYSVARRRGEIGIRMALGAAPSGIVRLVVSRVAWLVCAGIGIGGATALWAARFAAPLVYGLDARDPATLAGASVTLVLVALFAGWLPARRASKIDPADVLRQT